LPRSYASFAVALVATLLAINFVVLSTTPNSTTSVSALEANGVGIYWDGNFNEEVRLIDWGSLNPGSVRNITVYVQNEVDESQFLRMLTMDWDPSYAPDYIALRWDYSGQRLYPSEVLQITLTLSVSRYIEGITSFNFCISITGSDRSLGDVNGDGIVTARDIILVGNALFSNSGDHNYDPYADVNGDGKIGAADIIFVVDHLFESWP